MKAGVRFVSYDHFKHRLADSEVGLATNFSFELSDYFSSREKSVHLEAFSVILALIF